MGREGLLNGSWDEIGMIVVQHCECLKCCLIVKTVNFTSIKKKDLRFPVQHVTSLEVYHILTTAKKLN